MLALAVLVALSSQTSKGSDYSQVALISQVTRYKPGQSFLVGLRFRMKPEWHVYWRNPGDSGQEARVKWSLPKGWKASELMWPKPKVLIDTGIVNYGYDGEVTVLVRLTPASGTSPIIANLEWLVCNKEMCLPAKKTLRLQLKASPTELRDPRSAPIIASAEQRLPRKLPANLASATLSKDEITLKAMVLTGDPERGLSLRFFPYAPTLLANEIEQRSEANGKWIVLHLKRSEFSNGKENRLRGALAISRNLHDSFVEIDVPLMQKAGEKQ